MSEEQKIQTVPSPAQLSAEEKEAARIAQENLQRANEFKTQLRSLMHILTQFTVDAAENDLDVGNLSSAINLYKAVFAKGVDHRPDFRTLYESRPDDWASVVESTDWLTDPEVVIEHLLVRGEKKKLISIDLGAVFEHVASLEGEAVIMDSPAAAGRARTYQSKLLAYLLRIFVNIGDESEVTDLMAPLRHYEAKAGLPAYRRANVSAGLPMDQFFKSARAVAEEYGPKFGIEIPKGDFDPSILTEVGSKLMETLNKSGIDVEGLQKTLQGGDMTEIFSRGGAELSKIDYKEAMANLFPSQVGSGEVFDD